jgi:biotin carboxyl carrier protein
MEHPVRAPFAGRVVRLDCREGQQVAAGDLLLELAAGTDPG